MKICIRVTGIFPAAVSGSAYRAASLGLLLTSMALGAQAVQFTAEELAKRFETKPTEEQYPGMADPDGGDKAVGDYRVPGRNGVCEGSEDGNSHKNLVVVAMGPATAPRVDLSLQFQFASYTLTDGDKRELSEFVTFMRSDAGRSKRFTVSGHTDDSGDAKTNLRLSCARALTVRAYLVEQGVEPFRLGAYGFGSSRPLVPGVRNAPANRRVEFRLSGG